VSRYPNYDGRFLGVSGIQFTFDPSKPSYSRILKEDILVNNELLDYNRQYTVGASHFIASGFENYLAIPETDFLVLCFFLFSTCLA
jgi:5'-nucleotidase